MNDIDYELIRSFDNEYKADKNNKMIKTLICMAPLGSTIKITPF